MTTLNEIASSDLVSKEFPALAEGLGTIGDAQLRNRATIGGNLAEGDPEYDLPTLLLALDATVDVAGSQGQRKLTAEEYSKAQNRSSRASGDLIISVTIPIPAAKSGMAYVRIKHPARLTAVCAVAAVVRAERGRIVAARIALGGATDHPTRLEAVEKALLSGPVNGEQGPSEGAISVDGIAFRGDVFASAEYRRHLARVLTGRAIKQALLRTTA
jgi:carbon-monoxide dehydrogenase medium subunit